MRSDKSIAIVGVREQDVARVCLLIRQVLPRLEARWRWGIENHADLLVVDPSSLIGQMALNRARAAGIRTMVLDPQPGKTGDYVLKRPFVAADLADTLNRISREMHRPEGVEPYRYDFYYRDLGFEPLQRAPATPTVEAAPGFEDYLRRHPDRNQGVGAIAVRPMVALRPPGSPGAGKPPPDPDAWHLQPVPARRGNVVDMTARRKPAQTPHTLWAYLNGTLLKSPSRLQRADLPALVLDPVNRVFHSDAMQRSLQAHCGAASRPDEWQPLSAAELARVRREQPAQPYRMLLWLDALVHSGGQLATHLDPDAIYRLTDWLDIDDSLPRQQRIATTLVRPRPLDEAAEVSRTPMTEVYNTVNAFDAIGQVGCSRREPEPQARSPRHRDRLTTLVSRLRTLIETHGRDRIGLGSTYRTSIAGSVPA